MLFPTLDFGLFFVVVFALAWLLRDAIGLRKWLLLAASYFFYGFWDWRFLILIAVSSAINYFAGLALDRRLGRPGAVIGLAVVLNLTILGFFKYYGFFLESLGRLLEQLGIERDLPLMEIILPVGISFFTFQGISYVIDVHRGAAKAVKSPVDLFLYISFFPQLVAGPIIRASDFLPQLENRAPPLTAQMVGFGLVMIVIGLFKKMVIANYLAANLVDLVFFDPAGFGAIDLMSAVYGYAVQIYCDFSGYSDIAIGVAALLGFRFKRNFNQPYRAASLREFWRRWHISLSQWLRDYLYKPLGGSRKGTARTYINLLATMVLGGLWHGAALKFLLWGALHGGGLAIERAVGGVIGRGKPEPTPVGNSVLVKACAIVMTFHIVCLGWVFFRAQSLSSALEFLAGLGRIQTEDLTVTPFLATMIGFSLASQFLPENWSDAVVGRVAKLPPVGLGLALGLALLAIELVAPPGTAPFIYFQF